MYNFRDVPEYMYPNDLGDTSFIVVWGKCLLLYVRSLFRWTSLYTHRLGLLLRSVKCEFRFYESHVKQRERISICVNPSLR